MSDGLTCARCRRVSALPSRSERGFGRGFVCRHCGALLLPAPLPPIAERPRVRAVASPPAPKDVWIWTNPAPAPARPRYMPVLAETRADTVTLATIGAARTAVSVGRRAARYARSSVALVFALPRRRFSSF